LFPFFNYKSRWMYLFKKEDMDRSINVNNPSVIKFISDITNTIVSNIAVDHYFSLSKDKKMNILYAVFKIIKTTSETRVRLDDLQFRAFLSALWKRNEESENYEIAAILFDIINNYEAIKEFIKPPVKRRRKEPTKGGKTTNG
jgi:hypothetical protein